MNWIQNTGACRITLSAAWSFVGLGFFVNTLVVYVNNGYMPVAASSEIIETAIFKRGLHIPFSQSTGNLLWLADWIEIDNIVMGGFLSPGDIAVFSGVLLLLTFPLFLIIRMACQKIRRHNRT